MLRTLRIYSPNFPAYLPYGGVSCRHRVVRYVPRNYLSYNWQLVPSDHFPPVPPPPTLPSLVTINLISFSLSLMFLCFVLFADFTYKWYLTVFFLFCLTFHLAQSPQGPSMLPQMVGFPFLWLNNILLYVLYVPQLLYPSTCQWTLTLFPCLGYCK